MPKISVYVPDELLEQAKKADPELSMSAVLQESLRSRVVDRAQRPYATLSEELAMEQDAARRFVANRVHEAWANGYRVGLEFAKALPWEAFESFASVGWRLREMADAVKQVKIDRIKTKDVESWFDFRGLLSNVQARTERYLSTDSNDIPTGIGAEGFVDALRQVWEGGISLDVQVNAGPDKP